MATNATGSAAIGKPLKLGMLEMMTTTGFKKQFRSRFCILTTNVELDWYKKQEDCQEGKRGGSVSSLEDCVLEEVEDQGGEDNCFSITAAGKSYVFAAETERERLNWMVEILKFRGIEAIIDMAIVSHPLCRHAAYALCNLAGRSKDNSPILIVKAGGIDALLAVQRDCKEQDLKDSINYAISKLSLREENREEIGVGFLDHVFEMIGSDDNRTVDFGLQTLRNCGSNVAVRQRVHEAGGMKRFLAILFRKGSTETLQSLAGECLQACSANPEFARKLTTDHAEEIIAHMCAAPPTVQEPLVGLLFVLYNLVPTRKLLDEQRVVEKMHMTLNNTHAPLLSTALPLLDTMLDQRVNRQLARACDGCLRAVLRTLAVDNATVQREGIRVLENGWSSKAAIHHVEKEPAELLHLWPLVCSKDASIQLAAAKFVCNLTSTRPAEGPLAGAVDVLRMALKHLLTAARKESTPQEARTKVVDAAVALTNIPITSLLLCRPKLFSCMCQLVEAGGDDLPKALLLTLSCARAAAGKHQLASSSIVRALPSLLSDPLALPAQSAAHVAAEVSRESAIATFLADEDAVALLLPFATGVGGVTSQVAACKAIQNMAFFGAGQAALLKAMEPLAELLACPTMEVAELACAALLNCVADGVQSEWLLGPGLPHILSALGGSAKLQADSCKLLSVALQKRNLSEELRRTVLAAALPLMDLEKPDVAKNAMRVVSYCATDAPTCAMVEDKAALMHFLGSKDVVFSQLAAAVIRECIVQDASGVCCTPECVAAAERPLASSSAVLVDTTVDILVLCSAYERNKPALLQLVPALHAILLRPAEDTRAKVYKLLIDIVSNERKELEIKDLTGLQSFLAIATSPLVDVEAPDFRFRPSVGEDGAAVLELVSNPAKPAVFRYADADLMHEHLAKPLIYWHEGHEFSKPHKALRYLDQDRQEKSRRKTSQSTDSMSASRRINLSLSGDRVLSLSISQSQKKRKKRASTKVAEEPPTPAPAFVAATARPTRQPRSGISVGPHRAQLTTSDSNSNASDPSPRSISSPRSPRLPREQSSSSVQEEAPPCSSASRLTMREPGIVVPTRQHMAALACYLASRNEDWSDLATSLASAAELVLPATTSDFEGLPLQLAPAELLEVSAELPVKLSGHVLRYNEARCTGKVGMTRSKVPLSTTTSYGYFEVLVISAGKHGSIGVGLVETKHPCNQQPGWREGGWGFHGDDGNKYWNDGKWHHDAYGQPFRSGDIIGCGRNNVTNDIFFTRNGLFIDYAFGNVAATLYPAVGLGGPGEEVLINTGQQPFLWNFDTATMESAIFCAPPAARGQVCTFHTDAVRPKESKIFMRNFELVAASIGSQALLAKQKVETCTTCVMTPAPAKSPLPSRRTTPENSKEKRKRSMTSTDKSSVSQKNALASGMVPLSSIDI